jgi:hypothetical protein
MTRAEKQDRLRFAALKASEAFDSLEPLDRARLLEGLSLILTGAEAKQCAFAAFAIRNAEKAQLQFRELLKP